MNNFTIHGVKDSAAETYATENGFEFREIGSDDHDPNTCTFHVCAECRRSCELHSAKEFVQTQNAKSATTISTVYHATKAVAPPIMNMSLFADTFSPLKKSQSLTPSKS